MTQTSGPPDPSASVACVLGHRSQSGVLMALQGSCSGWLEEHRQLREWEDQKFCLWGEWGWGGGL